MCNLCKSYVQLFREGLSVCCPAWNRLGIIPKEGRTYMQIWKSEKVQEYLEAAAQSNSNLCYSTCPYYREGESARGLPKITRVMISFDETCNIRCQTCRNRIIKTPSEELQANLRELEQDFSEITDLELCGSGDPFASPVIRDWILNLSEEKFPNLRSIFIQTNGLCFTERIYKRLPEFVKNRLTKVIVSMDAPDKALYEKIRRGGNWDKLQKNLKFLASTDVYLAFCYVVQTDNYDRCIDFYDYCQGIKEGSQVMYQQVMRWGDRVTEEEWKRQNIYENEDPDIREELRHQLLAVSRKPNILMQGIIPPPLKPLKFLV